MRSNLDHLDGQLARRPFFINLLGQPFDLVQPGIFVVTTVLGGLLAWLALNPR
jgi:hypothetical protein